jgi:hypothetical protein
MNVDNLLQDITAKLLTNSAGVSVWREQLVVPSPPRAAGYLLWDFTVKQFNECSDSLTGTVEGDLDITCYATGDAQRTSLVTSVLDLWVPVDVTTGRRTGIGPVALTNCFLNHVRLTGNLELFPEKGSHPSPEIAGTFLTFHIKAQIEE